MFLHFVLKEKFVQKYSKIIIIQQVGYCKFVIFSVTETVAK